jgi:uncharacterized protein (TIGR02099 family)
MLAALLISAARLATPWLAQQKPLIEHWASTLLDQPVEINHLAINWEGFEPVLRCNDVVILDDARKQRLLRVQELDIGVSLIKSVFSGSFRLGHLRINGLHLIVRQDKTGQISISGINTPLANDEATTNNSDALNEIINWLLAEPAIALQDVSLTWYDQNNNVLPVNGLNFNIKNKGEYHTLWGQAQLAQTVASQLAFTIKLEGNWQKQDNLKADIYLKAQDILLPQWSMRLKFPGLNIKKGLTDFELWGHWQKKHWQSWQSLFILKNIAVSYDPSVNTAASTSKQPVKPKKPIVINLQHLSGNIAWQPAANGGWQIIGNQLQITFANQPWEANQFSVTVNPDYTQQHWQLSYINLTQLIPFLLKTQLLPTSWQNTLFQLNPKGILRNTELQYQAPAANVPAQFVFTTDFDQLAFNHWQHIPGAVHLTGHLQLAPTAGRLQLNSQQAQLDFGKLFRAPLYFDNLAAQANWQQTHNGWSVKANNIAIKNSDINVNAQAYLLVPANDNSISAEQATGPYLSLLAGYQLASAEHIANYLPLTELSPELVKWLTNSIIRVAHAKGTLIINGNLKDYPFENNNGTFIVDSHIDDADLAYWPQWPQLKHFSGELLFEGPSMRVVAQAGQIFSSNVKQLVATIPSLHKGAVLSINGQLTGDLNDALRILRESPLHDIVKNGVDDLAAQGPLQLQIGLTIPFAHGDPVKVAGQVDTQNAVLSLPKWNLQMPNFQGRLNFTESGLNANNLTATLWQKPVAMQITTFAKPQGMQIQFAGQADVKDIQKQFNLNLLNSMSGQGQYTVTLHVARQNAPDDLHIQSDLKGIAVDLPVPLAKTAEQSRNFEWVTNLSGAQAFNKFSINYGDLTAGIAKRASSWRINLQSPQAKGTLILPTDKQAAIQANFKRLYLTSFSDNQANNSGPLQPKDVPNLYFTCQDFRYGAKNFGAVTLNLRSIPNGIAINQLQAVSSAFKLTANGNWRTVNDHTRTTLAGMLTSPNIANALANWGFPIAGFTTKNSKVSFALQWHGAPYDLSLAKLSGNVSLELKNGQITEAGSDSQMKMNMGRILTFMSWQSIARRLQLDFSDLTHHGYSFNILKGDFSLNRGNAITKNTYLDGPMAKVNVHGRIGLVAEDFDMYLGVTAHLSSSLTLIAGIAGGPVVGIATGAASWLASKVFSKQMDKIAADNYHLVGPWNKPEVVPIKK